MITFISNSDPSDHLKELRKGFLGVLVGFWACSSFIQLLEGINYFFASVLVTITIIIIIVSIVFRIRYNLEIREIKIMGEHIELSFFKVGFFLINPKKRVVLLNKNEIRVYVPDWIYPPDFSNGNYLIIKTKSKKFKINQYLYDENIKDILKALK